MPHERKLRSALRTNKPTILLIHNAVDPMQMFGTEPHDFISDMYGELTVRLVNGKSADSFHGLNAKLRHDENVSFSGVGHLRRTAEGAEVTLLGVTRVEVEHAA
jgi:hypothetical protein